LRKVSDYYYAADIIQKLCKAKNIEFGDFDVLLGPIEQFMGRGSMGGFMDEKLFKKSKLPIPLEIQKGVFVSPPIMFINTVEIPSYSDQTETIIHEYTHYIYNLQHPNYEIPYGKRKKGMDYEYWYKYLTDPNEREAHKKEIKYELLTGKSYDEIIRDKVGGRITTENYPIAKKFSELVMEVVDEIEAEKNSGGTNDEEPA